MIGRTANKVLDKLHQATVGVLVLSTVYFGVEAFRATWYIQKHKAEQRVRTTMVAVVVESCCCVLDTSCCMRTTDTSY
jgi:Fe2+ or Zn2+ uptake regulation protein